MAEVSLNSYVNAIVAALDLVEVQLITQAMRTADLAGAAQNQGPYGITVGPAAIYEPHAFVRHEARVEARNETYTAHAVRYCWPCERDMKACCTPPPPMPKECCIPTVVHEPPAPIQPPWAQLPWPVQNPAPPAKVIKVLIAQPDNLRSGTILDCFI